MMIRLLLAVTVFTTGCSGLFYYPSPVMVRTPADIGLAYERIEIRAEGQDTLRGWFLPARQETEGTIVFLHGNAENISTHFGSVYWLPSFGYQVFLFDYAGYGESDGEVSVDGIHRDVDRMVRAVLADSRADRSKLFLLGESLGGAMALYTAATAEHRCAFSAIISVSPFSSYRSIAREKLSLFWITYSLQYPLGFLFDDSYSPVRVIGDVAAPVLFVHGESDETVPAHHSEKLCDLLGSRCTRIAVGGAGHGDTLGKPDVRQKVVEFMRTSDSTPVSGSGCEEFSHHTGR